MFLCHIVGNKYFTNFSVTRKYMYVYTNENSYFVICTVCSKGLSDVQVDVG
jgi:hypothetical protein